MNININFTIILQAIHFFIAYLLVRWAFNPLWLAIKVRRDQQDYLHRSIVGIDHDIDRAQKHHTANWQKFSAQISDRINTLSDRSSLNKDAKKVAPAHTKQHSDHLNSEVVEKLAHAVVAKTEGKYGTR